MFDNIPVIGIFSTIGAVIVLALVASLVKWVLNLRRVVPSNEVHIVQSKVGRITYGRAAPVDGSADQTPGTGASNAGNIYYHWPTWVPKLGVQVFILPLTVFDQDLKRYEAYDSDRVPFWVDVKAFYRISNPHLAAERISSMAELTNQLLASLQGAIRSILASYTIEQIMAGRSEFGVAFTAAVDSDLSAWGVTTVKSIELMDLRDAPDHKVIENITAKRESAIDKESRVEVAKNRQAAESAEIDSKQAVIIRSQDSELAVGLRAAEVKQDVGIADQKALQQIQVASRETESARMEVKSVVDNRTAEIAKTVAVTDAERVKQTSVINAEAESSVATIQATANREVVVTTAKGEKERMEAVALGQLALAENEAKGIEAKGMAQGAAAKALAMAPVEAELALAAGLGANAEYQNFVVRRDSVTKDRDVGIAQAAALQKADVKVIANTGDAGTGLSSVGELFTSKGGLKLASMVEAFAATPAGATIVAKVVGAEPDSNTTGDQPNGVRKVTKRG